MMATLMFNGLKHVVFLIHFCLRTNSKNPPNSLRGINRSTNRRTSWGQGGDSRTPKNNLKMNVFVQKIDAIWAKINNTNIICR